MPHPDTLHVLRTRLKRRPLEAVARAAVPIRFEVLALGIGLTGYASFSLHWLYHRNSELSVGFEAIAALYRANRNFGLVEKELSGYTVTQEFAGPSPLLLRLFAVTTSAEWGSQRLRVFHRSAER